MYVSCVVPLWRQRMQRKNSLFILAYITIGFIIQTVYCAFQARVTQVQFVDSQGYPGGPLSYFLDRQAQANVVLCTLLLTTIFLSDLLVVGRSPYRRRESCLTTRSH